MDSKNISGYDLALHVLSHERGGVEALLSLSGNDESCWLELKAGMALLPEDEKRGEKPDDLYWKIAKAVISLMNTSGGIVLIGIEDKTHAAIPLQSNDPRHVIEKSGLEAYRRKEIFERIWPDGKSWKYRNETWKIEDSVPENLIEVKGVKYRGEDIAAILVKPAPTCVRVWKNGEVEQILVRESGELGKGKSIIGSKKMAEYEKTRHIETEFLKSLYEKFLAQVEKSSDDGIINDAIRQYYLKFNVGIRKNRLFDLSCFVDLGGYGEIPEEEDDVDFMAPRAIEFESDGWLSSDGDESDDEDDEEDREEVDEEDDETEIRREQRSGDLIALMQEIPRIVVLGEPGGGKTTSLIRFCTLFDTVGEDVPETLAVFIPMGQWIKGGSLASLLTGLTGLSAGQWESLIRQRRLRLVIDAFNECPDQYKAAALADLKAFLQHYPDLPAVISARTDAELKELRLPMFTVQPMDREHQRLYLCRYLKDEAAADELLNRLAAMSGGTALAANPMLLRLIVEVFKLNGEIPNGRAGLYHQWLSQWYTREFGKAKQAGAPLPWDFDDALNILSELAMRGRLQGYRDIPLDFAKEILQEHGSDCIEKLCQGPVVTIDNDFIRFRHETFQEYLCAERLVKKPERLADRKLKNPAQWAMVLAYAAELCWPLPDELWLFAWRIDPWFGVALTDDKRALEITDDSFTGRRPKYQGKPLSFRTRKTDCRAGVLYAALLGIRAEPVAAQAKGYKNNWNLRGGRTVWGEIRRFSRYIEYIILTNEEIRNRWIRFELWRFADSPKYDTIIFYHPSVSLGYRCECEKTTVPRLLEQYRQSPSLPDELKKKLDALVVRCFGRIKRASVFTAERMIAAGWAAKEDFADKLPEWIRKSNHETALRMIDAGWAVKEDFADRIPEWIENATPKIAEYIIRNNLATKEDFADKIPVLGKCVNKPGHVLQLIRSGLATREDFSDKISEWVAEATPPVARQLICTKLAAKEDFADKVPEWIKNANITAAGELIDVGLAAKEDFADKVPEWMANSTPQTALQLIQLGFARKCDFADRVPEWVANASPKMMKKILKLGVVTEVDINKPYSRPAGVARGASGNESSEVMEPDPSDWTDRKYTMDMLTDEAAINKCRAELAGKKWLMEVCISTPNYSFFQNDAFPDKVFCGNLILHVTPELGSIWSVKVKVAFDKKKGRYGFVAAAAKMIAAAPQAESAGEKADGESGDGAPNGNPDGGGPPLERKDEVIMNQDVPEDKERKCPAEAPAAETGEARIKFVDIAKTLQAMSCAKNEIVYLAKRPEKWDLSFAFCCSHREDINKLISLLQSLANSAKMSEGVLKTKRDGLARLVHAHREFESILPNMPVPPPLPPPKPTAAKNTASKTPTVATKKKKSKKAAAISANATPVKVDYDPEIKFSRGEATVKTVTKFSKNSSHIRIYIDEAWPGDQAPEYKYIGVISGIVWDGDAPDYKILPKVQTHLRERDDPVLYQKTLKGLFGCSKAFPFIFPIAKQHVNSKDYPELLRMALITLLGWILPQDGCRCEVEIFCEGIKSAQMAPGENYADELKGFHNALGLTSGRMRRWYFTHFESLHESNKSFEYVPYADALGYLTVPIVKAQNWGRPFNATQLPGYVPLTVELIRQLNALDSDSPRGCAETLFDFAGIYSKTKLFFHVLEQILEKAHDDPEFRDALFERLEEMFREKQRDVGLLKNLCDKLIREFPLEVFSQYPLIRLLVELQSANHSGTPEAAEECVRQYRQLRNALIEDNRELCAYTDMNLAVHYNDQFDFAAAAAICRPWESDPAFEFISRGSRGTILSSIGQSYAFAGDCEHAYEYFVRALKLFSGPPLLKDEVDQTAVYCALNLLDGRRFPVALKMAESVFKCGIAEAIDHYADNTDMEYHHHLLVKNLFFNPGAAEHIPAYLERHAAWQTKPQHPWELIELYRILLLHRAHPDEAKERIAALWTWYDNAKGSVFRILEAFARCVIFANCGDADCAKGVPDLLAPIKDKLPSAADICQKLRCAATGQLSADEIWQILPFNYK